MKIPNFQVRKFSTYNGPVIANEPGSAIPGAHNWRDWVLRREILKEPRTK